LLAVGQASDQTVSYPRAVGWLQRNRDGLAANTIVNAAFYWGPGVLGALGGFLAKLGSLPAWGILLVSLAAFGGAAWLANGLRSALARGAGTEQPTAGGDVFDKEIAWLQSLP